MKPSMLRQMMFMLAFASVLTTQAQERAADYFFPTFERSAYLVDNGAEMFGSAFQQDLYARQHEGKVEYVAEYSFFDALDFYPNMALMHFYQLNAQGEVLLTAHGKFKLDEVLSYPMDLERVTLAEPVVFFKIPSSDAPVLWNFTDPVSGKRVSARAKLTTVQVYGQSRKAVEVLYRNLDINGNTEDKTWTFAKGLGLYSVGMGEYGTMELEMPEIPADSLKTWRAASEEALRTLVWDDVRLLRKMAADTLNREAFDHYNKGFELFRKSLVKLDLLVEKQPSRINTYRHMAGVAAWSFSDKSRGFWHRNARDKYTASTWDMRFMDYIMYIRPTVEFYSISSIQQDFSKLDENFYQNYQQALANYCQDWLRIGVENIKNIDRYNAWHTVAVGEQFLREKRNATTSDQDNVTNALAYANSTLGDKVVAEEFRLTSVLNLRNFDKETLAKEEKYIKAQLEELSKAQVPDDKLTELTRALDYIEKYPEALKYGNRAIDAKVYTDKDFVFAFAHAAWEMKDKTSLRKVMPLLDEELSSMSETELGTTEAYYAYLPDQAGLNRVKAQRKANADKAAAEAKAREEADIARRKREEEEARREARLSRGVQSTLAISTNPFNLIWKSIPIAADLKLGKVILHGRYKMYFGQKSKYRFGQIGGDGKEFENIRGNEITGGLKFVMQQKKVGYQGATNLGYWGPQLMYSTLTTQPNDYIQGTDVSTGAFYSSYFNPKITRYEGTLAFGLQTYNKKIHVFTDAFMQVGVGYRSINIDYDQYDIVTEGFTNETWNKYYIVFKMGFRFGLHL